ncbi:MAG: response regulator, partial [Sphingomonadales bacterium]
VEIDTAPGEGTVVRVLLPVHHGAASAPKASSIAETLPRARAGETVLVVEDEERVRSYSVEALRELGYTVLDARDGVEALNIIARGQSISLLFSDVVMPEMGGRELAARAAAVVPGLKVLLTSGYTPESVGDADRDILGKPFDLAQLANRVRAALDA